MKTLLFSLLVLAFVLSLALVPARRLIGQGHCGFNVTDAGQAPPAGQDGRVYTADGVIRRLDPAGQNVVITHGPVPALGWPGMTMGFALEDASLLEGLKPGDQVRFDFRNEGNADVIVDIELRQ
jgi:Cu(I)/Ag(I) efflux system protein CusF